MTKKSRRLRRVNDGDDDDDGDSNQDEDGGEAALAKQTPRPRSNPNRERRSIQEAVEEAIAALPSGSTNLHAKKRKAQECLQSYVEAGKRPEEYALLHGLAALIKAAGEDKTPPPRELSEEVLFLRDRMQKDADLVKMQQNALQKLHRCCYAIGVAAASVDQAVQLSDAARAAMNADSLEFAASVEQA